jgi:hypothetical protein
VQVSSSKASSEGFRWILVPFIGITIPKKLLFSALLRLLTLFLIVDN